MNEVILLLLAIVGVFSVACSAALLALGKMIDLYPVGDESGRQRGLASPVETTKLPSCSSGHFLLSGRGPYYRRAGSS